MKKKGFGEGKYNGFGGKVEKGETIEESLKREALEEVGIIVKKFSKRAIIKFKYLNKKESETQEVHIFKIEKYENEPIESEEMKPEWFDIKRIPYDKMWTNDRYWLPLFLQEKKIIGEFLFDKDENVLKHKLLIVDKIVNKKSAKI